MRTRVHHTAKRYEKQLLAAILLTSFLLLSPVRGFDYQPNWDDDMQILENSFVQDPAFTKILPLFTQPVAGMFQPLVTLMFGLEAALFGSKPGVFHAFSLFWHLLAVFAAYRLSRAWSDEPLIALMAAALFAFYPAAVEPVAWISARSTLMYATFTFFSIAMWLKWEKSNATNDLLLFYLLLLLALLSKVQAILIPFLALSLMLFHRRRWQYDLPRLLPAFVMAGVFLLIGLRFRPEIDGADSMGDLFLSSGEKLLWYFKRWVWFGDSAPIHPPFFTDVGSTALLVSWPILSGLLLWLYFRQNKLFFPGIFFLAFISLHLIQFSIANPVADRYAYLPWWAGANIIAFALGSRVKTAGGWWLMPALLLGGYFGYMQTQLLPMWKDQASLWQAAVREHPAYYFGHEKAANAAAARGELPEAIKHYKQAIELENNSGRLYFNAGLAYFQLGNAEKALEAYQKAVSLEPTVFYYYMNLGRTYFELGRMDEAKETLLRGEALNPNDAAVQMTLAQFALLSGALDPCPYLEKAVRLGERQAAALYNQHCKKD